MPTDWPFDPETGELSSPPQPNLAEISVSDLAQALKRTLEDRFGHVRVRGEISGYRGPHASGHCYFAIKDAGAKLDAVIWRGSFNRLRSKLQEGLEVLATGKISSYPQKSGYQLIVEQIEPAGVGALMALLEERRKLLAAEGLFDAARKKPLPYLPRVIGVVTSPTGAVIRDILHRLQDRFPRRVLVWPVRVQGEGSAAEVAAAIRGFNALEPQGTPPRPDLLIVARGGGSLEDLWGFNEEIVVRAASESAIPLISAVGHETDTTLIDHAADLRAPTPTAAAERAVPVRAELLTATAALDARLRSALPRLLNERRMRLRAAERALPRADDVLAQARQRLDAASGRLAQSLRMNTTGQRARLTSASARLTARPLQRLVSDNRQHLAQASRDLLREAKLTLERRRRALTQSAQLLSALSYQSVLQRGYAVVRGASGEVIASAAAIRPAQPLALQFADGEAGAIATPLQGSLF